MKKFILIAAATILTLSVSAQNLKIAHVNFAELVQLMPASDSARAQLSASSKETQDTYQSMVDEFQSKYQQYQAKAGTWTAAVKESKEKELNDIQQRLQEFSQRAEQELQQQQNQLMAPIQQKAMDVVEKLAKDGGYAIVLDDSQALYINKSFITDLTQAARKALGIPDGRTLETLQQELQAQAQAAGN